MINNYSIKPDKETYPINSNHHGDVFFFAFHPYPEEDGLLINEAPRIKRGRQLKRAYVKNKR